MDTMLNQVEISTQVTLPRKRPIGEIVLAEIVDNHPVGVPSGSSG
jgi:hypothetical protein